LATSVGHSVFSFGVGKFLIGNHLLLFNSVSVRLNFCLVFSHMKQKEYLTYAKDFGTCALRKSNLCREL